MSNAKKKKFKIEPNSLSPQEENAVKSVMNRFRSRSADSENVAFELQVSEKDNSGDQLKNKQVSEKEINGDTDNDKRIPENLISGDTKLHLAATPKIINGDPHKEITGINIPENELKVSAKSGISGINIPAKELTATRKIEQTGKRGRPATGRTNKDVHIRVNPEFWKEMQIFAKEIDMDVSQLVQHALRLYRENYKSPQNELAGINIPHDDRRLRTLYKTKPRIIHLYSAYAENSRWTVNDDAKASALNDVDLRIIELGILQTLGNRKQKGKINSFGYFLPEIENFLEIEMPEEGIEAMLQINRKSFLRLTGKTVDLSFLNEPAE